MKPIRVAQIGCGYWGQNLIRNFWEVEGAEVIVACDPDEKALARMRRRYPTVTLTAHYEDVLSNPAVDAVILATPVSTHHDFAKRALLAGKHVLVEKPIATSSVHVIDLIETAAKQDKVLMVDHTFLYTSAVRRMKSLIDAGELGEILYFDSVRINLGLVQSDTNVLWDLGPHDFSIMDYLLGQEPVSVTATGVKHLRTPYENIAYVTARFDSNVIAHFHLNWLAPVKVRRTLVGGSQKMLVYDDMENSEKIKIYDRGVSQNHDPANRERLLTSYRNGDSLAPNLDTTEAMRLMAKEFIASIIEKRAPLSDGYSGLRVVRLLEAAQHSIQQDGREVLLSPMVPRPQTLATTAASVA
ncbi:MAG TPA: Gfo/Idh/MocA family oxidoreductase [Candidatus Angelobacter sp.]|nr:Gfo/Idh/MocA family oxidoreductase [Candidatus Angelobacter sp.]